MTIEKDRILTRHSVLENEMKRIVKASLKTKLEVSTRTDYKIYTISYHPSQSTPVAQYTGSGTNTLTTPSTTSPKMSGPGFQLITPKFKKTFKGPLVDYQKEHLKLEKQEKKYKQRDLEKIINSRLKQPRVKEVESSGEVKELKADEIYKLEFRGEPSELIGLGSAGDVVAKHGIKGIYFENMVVKLKFKRPVVDVGCSSPSVDKEKPDSDSNDVSGTFIPKTAKKKKSVKTTTPDETVIDASSTSTTKPKISRSRAFGFPLPVFKKLDLDYCDGHWEILNEKGIF